jgi:hypothetical protein
VSPRVREESVHPRLQLGARVRPLNFTVRRQIVATPSFDRSYFVAAFFSYNEKEDCENNPNIRHRGASRRL